MYVPLKADFAISKRYIYYYDDGGLSIGAYIGIVLGILVVSCLIQFLVWQREPPKRNQTRTDSQEPYSVNISSDHVPLSAPYQPAPTYRKVEAESYEMNNVSPSAALHGSHY
ncbi:hypothetical protein V1517DRAFT_335943 [Lipomyces orientalis]|uniref:Uncharacterized protein n=1 Tax=Lipomyces orientalis TaxID=1233043 RepID=A0ACC3TWG0_9ASCO